MGSDFGRETDVIFCCNPFDVISVRVHIWSDVVFLYLKNEFVFVLRVQRLCVCIWSDEVMFVLGVMRSYLYLE